MEQLVSISAIFLGAFLGMISKGPFQMFLSMLALCAYVFFALVAIHGWPQ